MLISKVLIVDGNVHKEITGIDFEKCISFIEVNRARGV